MSSELDPTASLALIGRVSDLSLTIGAEGAIHRCTVSSEDIPQALEAEWTGRDWVGTATDESRTRATELRELALARPGSSVRRDVTQRWHLKVSGCSFTGQSPLVVLAVHQPTLHPGMCDQDGHAFWQRNRSGLQAATVDQQCVSVTASG